ncbi:MAG: MalY/PatB family protein [Verrucomicrobiales bacterium]
MKAERFPAHALEDEATTSALVWRPHPATPSEAWWSKIQHGNPGRKQLWAAMAFDFDTVIERRGTGSLKWQRYEGRDVFPLWVADMDFAAPPVVIEAIRARLDHGVLGYTKPHPGLNETVLGYMERAHSIAADAAWIEWLPGLVPAKSMACRAVGNPGDSVITLTPVYPPFLAVHADAQKRLITVPLAHDEETGHWAIDFDALERAVRPDTRVFLFCNPHNPVGRVYRRVEVERVADFCVRHDLLLVSDEIHCDLILEADWTPHFSAARLEGPIRDRLIVLMAASKTFNIPGLALAWALVPNPTLRRQFRAAGGRLIPELNPLSYHATHAALRDGEPWRQELLACLRDHRDHLARFLKTNLPRMKMALPLEATYLAWLDCRGLGVENPHAFFEQAGVGLSDGRDFAGAGWLRLNFGCPRSTLDAALHRMAEACR